MSESWDADLNGAAPSFQEFLAAEHAMRARFVAEYMSSRGLRAPDVDAATLEEYLARFGSKLAHSRAEAERLLDDLLRVRPRRIGRAPRGSHGQLG